MSSACWKVIFSTKQSHPQGPLIFQHGKQEEGWGLGNVWFQLFIEFTFKQILLSTSHCPSGNVAKDNSWSNIQHLEDRCTVRPALHCNSEGFKGVDKDRKPLKCANNIPTLFFTKNVHFSSWAWTVIIFLAVWALKCSYRCS